MYSVFAVDDEPIVLEGIRSKIDWEGSGFSFAGEATDLQNSSLPTSGLSP